jgi:hypothetical protein
MEQHKTIIMEKAQIKVKLIKELDLSNNYYNKCIWGKLKVNSNKKREESNNKETKENYKQLIKILLLNM